ncbi:MAG TPA: hypothetical protein PK514_05220 [Spirochaetota bacterium]|nr:hypothetical protein [Spirochaetota bacterium]
MTFKEIIRENADRLFVVDTECFIIFTGSSINDDRPFIRIGTWYDLPVEIIPLIENIIITDKILGNPAHEQFNIDIRNLVANRYIGGESIIKRFLDYQKNFGLDLTNVSIVNIEKDIPELPKKSSVSDRDQFIGVFYSDGNIKIVHDKSDIFDLNSMLNDNLSITTIQEKISSDSKGSDRYSGSGFVIAGNNPVFYGGGYFTSYQYPSGPFDYFSTLRIDPSRIREVLLPSQNILNLSSLMKFKNARDGKIRIFSDNPEQIDLIKKLFKNCTLVDERFSGINYNTGEGLRITGYDNSPNLKLFCRTKGSTDEMTVAFIKLHHETKRMLKENPDLVLITYTAYEESALLFKSTEVPVIIIDDGNPHAAKIASTGLMIKRGIQYEFRKFQGEDEIINMLAAPEEVTAAFAAGDVSSIEEYIEGLAGDKREFARMFNTATLLKLHMNSTSDRRFFSALRQIHQKYFSRVGLSIPDDQAQDYCVILGIFKNSCYQIPVKVDQGQGDFFTDVYSSETVRRYGMSLQQKILGEKILADRIRLLRLLRYFYDDRRSSGKLAKLEEQILNLKDEIENRKEIYSVDLYPNAEDAVSGIHTRTGGAARKHTSSSLIFNEDADGYDAAAGAEVTGGYDAVHSAVYSDDFAAGKNTGITIGKENVPFYQRAVHYVSSVFAGRTGEGPDAAGRSGSAADSLKKRLMIAIPVIILLLALLAFLLYKKRQAAIETAGAGGTGVQVQDIAGSGTAGVKDKKGSAGTGEVTETGSSVTGPVITVKRVNPEEKELLIKRNVMIRDIDIFNYANDVAVKNGYEKITYKGIKQKNPHWIYPGNLFIMLDGEKVVVQSGDTLWDLAHAKLEKMNADFYKVIEELEKTDTSDKKKMRELIDRADQYSYIPQQKKIIAAYRSKIENE